MSRKEILASVKSYNVLAHYLAPYHNHPRLQQGVNISNPFLLGRQATPSFNIYCDQQTGHEWKFKDFATDDHGSCFDLVMRLFNLSFSEAKAKICRDFGLTSANTKLLTSSAPLNPEHKPDASYSIKARDFNAQELDFWKKYGIPKETLTRFNVKALSGFSTTTKEGKPYSIQSTNNNLIFAYDQGTWVKLYKPLGDRKYRFQYLGNKPQNFVFGLEQLPEKGDFIFLTGGEKDAMTLAARGYHAISLNSETAKPTTELLADLRSRFTDLVIVYDNDKTGLEQSEALASAFGLARVILPAIPKNGKDISDFFANGGTVENFNQVLSNRIPLPELANLANSANPQELGEYKESNLLNMPFLPEWVYPALPEILRKGTEAFKDRREKDIFLASALGILSGCMRSVSGSYNGKVHYANLFVFVIAPAASGKGALTFAKQLGEKFHKRLLEESEKQHRIYLMELAEYKQKISQKNADIRGLEPPTEPPFKILFVPGNSSHSRLFQHLSEGEEQGIFCETEADSMNNAMKQDWGSYSDLLRKAFHHEPISLSRKTNKEYIEINRPKLSVVLSGTPGQVEGLIKSAEDGLFSRFLFYTFKSAVLWIDAGPTIGGVNLSQHFEDLSNRVLELVDYLEMNGKVEFHLTAEQWNKLNEFGRSAIQDMTAFVSEELASTAKRFGLILYRLAMVLTVLRYFENGEAETNFVCSDGDFEIALALMQQLKEHSVFMFKELPKTGKMLDPALKRMLNALPQKFQRKEAISLALAGFQVPERTADFYLSKLVQTGHLLHPRSGFYEKPKMA